MNDKVFTKIFARAFFVGTFLSFAAPGDVARADWPSWRGPDNSGSIEQGSFPMSLDDTNLIWKSSLPGKGCSTPIVIDKNIFVTAPVKGKDALLKFDWNGKKQWVALFGDEVSGRHKNGSGTNSSPVSDGKFVFVYFKSGTLAAVDNDGSTRWTTNLIKRFGKDELFWDYGTSPVLTDSHVIIARMHGGDSWVAAFNKETGEMDWKIVRNFSTPTECDHGYSSPLVIDHQGRQCILVWGAQHVTIHDAVDGNLLWQCGNFNPDNEKLWPSIAMPVISGEILVIAYGRNDRRNPRLHGVSLDGSGDVTKENHVWLRDDVGTFVPSPVVYKGNVYLVRDQGEVECIDVKSGKTVWSDRFPKSRSKFYASPLIAGDILYAPREDGVVFVASVADGKFQSLGEREMQEPVIGSPVPEDNRVFIRGEKHLYCFQANDANEK